ncbi:MAG: hypothetical protein JXN60_01390 [Lentisphaerae bacterium]|nr:hypothetical protein [Lentisphaerota bacterium]
MLTSHTGIFVVGLSTFLAVQAYAVELKILHFPEAAYADERVTFVAEGRCGEKVSAYLDGVELEAGTISTNILEFNFSIPKSGMLTFTHGCDVRKFQVVQPDDIVFLSEKNGYLYVNDVPAILLARHLHIPKHDRRWETATLFSKLITDTRPIVMSGVLVGADFLNKHEPIDLNEIAGNGTNVWQYVKISGTSELNAIAICIRSVPLADLLVLALSDRDLERGIDDLQFETKLAWCMQVAVRHGFKHFFLVMPPLHDDQRERFPGLALSMEVWAKSHHAVFIETGSRTPDRALDGRKWFRRVLKNINKTVKFGEVTSRLATED